MKIEIRNGVEYINGCRVKSKKVVGDKIHIETDWNTWNKLSITLAIIVFVVGMSSMYYCYQLMLQHPKVERLR